MKKSNFIVTASLVLSFSFLISLSVQAEESKKKVKYKSQGRIDFESLLIEGERKKPEMAVVTGNIGEKDSGLLKFRKDFLDVMAQDFGESVE
jgi:hypothetical protein